MLTSVILRGKLCTLKGVLGNSLEVIFKRKGCGCRPISFTSLILHELPVPLLFLLPLSFLLLFFYFLPLGHLSLPPLYLILLESTSLKCANDILIHSFFLLTASLFLFIPTHFHALLSIIPIFCWGG